MTVLKFCMLAVVGLCAATVIKQWKGEWLPLLRVGLAVLFGIAAIGAAAPLVRYLEELLEVHGLSDYATILLKALGIAVLTQSCADICRECGETSAASGVELAGRVELLLLALPLMGEVLEAARQLLTLS